MENMFAVMWYDIPLGGVVNVIHSFLEHSYNTDHIYVLHAAACMTWELAESGIDFITSVINGADLVPTFSAASVDDLRVEVTFLIAVI